MMKATAVQLDLTSASKEEGSLQASEAQPTLAAPAVTRGTKDSEIALEENSLIDITPCTAPSAPKSRAPAAAKMDLMNLPPEVLYRICCELTGRRFDGPVNATCARLLERMRVFTNGAKSHNEALRCSCKGLEVLGNSVCTSVHFSCERVEEVKTYLAKLFDLELVSVSFPSNTDAHAFRSCLQLLCSLQPVLAVLILYCVTEPPLHRKLKAAVGDLLLSWGSSLKRLSLHNVDCGTSDLGFLSNFSALLALQLFHVSPSVRPDNLLACSSLVELSLKGTHIVESDSLDLSCCPFLKYVACFNSTLNSLSVRGLKNLVHLSCSNNNLSTLDVWDCTALTQLKCTNNKFTLLDATNNHALRVLECSSNPIIELDLTCCKLLTKLVCQHCSSMDDVRLSKCVKLQTFDSSLAAIIAEELQVCPDLISIRMVDNYGATTLHVAGFTYLTSVIVIRNSIMSADFTGCTAMTRLWLSDIPCLTSIEASCCTSLKELSVTVTGARCLNVLGCTNIVTLSCVDCFDLKSLDLSSCTSLQDVSCEGSFIKSLNFAPSAATLEKLSCNCAIELKRLCITGCSKLSQLSCSNCLLLEELDCVGCFSLVPAMLNLFNAGKFSDMNVEQLLTLGK